MIGTGIKALATACGFTQANLYGYFKNLDDLIIQSTAYCMAKVEEDFMSKAPVDLKDIGRFLDEIPLLDGKRTRKKISPDVSGLYAPEIYGLWGNSFSRASTNAMRSTPKSWKRNWAFLPMY